MGTSELSEESFRLLIAVSLDRDERARPVTKPKKPADRARAVSTDDVTFLGILILLGNRSKHLGPLECVECATKETSEQDRIQSLQM